MSSMRKEAIKEIIFRGVVKSTTEELDEWIVANDIERKDPSASVWQMLVN